MSILPLPAVLVLLFLLPFDVNSQTTTNRNDRNNRNNRNNRNDRNEENEEKDQNTLLNLKHFWSNPASLSHWKQSSNPCSWPEIRCNGTTVTGITIVDKDINGTVPPYICELKNITYLDLNYNYFTGDFPKGLYNCTSLQYLDLSLNYFVGRIPDDVSRLSPELQYLNLSNNNFTGDIPVNISRLSKLSSLQLHQNQFNGSFPEEIGHLNNLEELNLAYNDFIPSRLPLSFTQLKKVRKFYMWGANLIEEIPGNLSSMAAMELLDLSQNQINGSIPSDLFMLENLTEVYLYENNLTGRIPDSIEAMNMKIIDLSENKLSGKIPDGFGKLTSLTNLTLMFNQLSGEVPVGVGRLPRLEDIRIFDNNLSGPLPPDFGRYSDLKRFEVCLNQFTGNLPVNLCYRGKLLGVSVYYNHLSGEIPKSLENCSSLNDFRVYGNKFSGVIPDGLWKVSTLEAVMISGNSFSGELPKELAPKLSTLEISNNRFSGQIPTGVSSWKSLRVFKASYNLLKGAIPQALTSLPNLETLLLDGNQFSGVLPKTIVSWSSLNTLNLSRNQLTGQIPVGLGFLEALTALDLSRNNLSGHIPSELGKSLVLLDLSGNNLTGVIPSQLNNGAFGRSFLNNPGLCSDNPLLRLNSCSSQSKTKSSSKITAKFVVIIASIAVILLLLTVLITGYVVVVVPYQRRKSGVDSKCKFTSFQKLNFTESIILSGLTEGNMIGHGGSGKVYRVAVRLGEFVAVKMISCIKDLDQRFEKDFLAEVNILSTIRHSNIVKLMCCISCDYSKLLVYEYLENRSLDRWLHQKQTPSSRGLNGSVHHVVLDWPKRLRIALGAARGLCYMHHDCSPGIVHRDVKSSNVLLDGEFNAKIADFGLARILAKESELSTMSTVAGSFGYMAPEYAHTTKVNEKIDVYSFGVILLELTTGKEASNGNEHLSLAEWAWQQALDGAPIADALDIEFQDPMYLNEMASVYKLGLLCTSTRPSNRPSMKEVCRLLLRCSMAAGTGNNIGDVADHFPLLELENG